MYTVLLLCFFFIDSELQKEHVTDPNSLLEIYFLDKAKACADVSATKSSGFSLVWELFFPYAGIQVI